VNDYSSTYSISETIIVRQEVDICYNRVTTMLLIEYVLDWEDNFVRKTSLFSEGFYLPLNSTKEPMLLPQFEEAWLTKGPILGIELKRQLGIAELVKIDDGGYVAALVDHNHDDEHHAIITRNGRTYPFVQVLDIMMFQ
jgi:hypothetical protein